MKLGYQTITWGGVVGQAQGVTSVKDLFYQTYGSTAKACEDIAAAGYSGIEIFDGNLAEYANNPNEFKDLLKKHNLELVSVYTGANFIYNDILVDEFHKLGQAISFAQTMGAKNLIVGGGAKRSTGTTEEDFRMLADGLDRVTDLAAAAGLTACYHPHLTTIVETTAELEKIMNLSKIHFCPDTAHLAAGGVDAAAAIRKYGNRVRHVHLKDFKENPFAFLPLGLGDIDFKNIFAALKEISYDGWLIVELDGYNGNPKDAADISMKFIKENLK